jgi:hypothetical protein
MGLYMGGPYIWGGGALYIRTAFDLVILEKKVPVPLGIIDLLVVVFIPFFYYFFLDSLIIP